MGELNWKPVPADELEYRSPGWDEDRIGVIPVLQNTEAGRWILARLEEGSSINGSIVENGQKTYLNVVNTEITDDAIVLHCESDTWKQIAWDTRPPGMIPVE